MLIPSYEMDDMQFEIPRKSEEYIINPYFEKQKLTYLEALDLLNLISGMLMADGRYRKS